MFKSMYSKMKAREHNRVEIYSNDDAVNKNSFPKLINKFNIFKIKKSNKRVSLLSIIIIIIEVSFILLTFFLCLNRFIDAIYNKNDLNLYNNLLTVKNDVNNVKICLCTPGKQENKYIREFVQFYEKMGVDKIFLYDNNNVDGEKFEEVINDYINNGFVEISDWRGKDKQLINMMNDCYQKNYEKYDWLMFYDVDEFIHLKNYQNIKEFLTEKKFNGCQKIYLNWVFHTDNDLLHYENTTVQERFPIIEYSPKNKKRKYNYVKSIIRGHISNVKIESPYSLNNDINGCNGRGQEVELNSNKIEEQDFENYYIDHYFSKSLDEFIEKLKRGDANMGKDNNSLKKIFGNYFEYNKMTKEKIEYIEKGTGLDLSEYKKLLNDKN